MAWRRLGDNQFSEPMMVRLLMYLCVSLSFRVRLPSWICIRWPEYWFSFSCHWWYFNFDTMLITKQRISFVWLCIYHTFILCFCWNTKNFCCEHSWNKYAVDVNILAYALQLSELHRDVLNINKFYYFLWLGRALAFCCKQFGFNQS